jgi:DNA-binding transcriptional ArsR family regulator
MAAECAVVETTDQAAVLLDPVRLQILARLREPDSAAEVARSLGMPRQRVGYHIRELEKGRLLRFVGERRRGNCVEHLLQATADYYVVGPSALGAVSPDTRAGAGGLRDRFSSAYLIAAASRTIGDVATLRERARGAGKQLPTLTLESEVRFTAPEQQRAFAEELTESIARLVAKYHDAGPVTGQTAGPGSAAGRRFRIVVSGHPALPTNPPHSSISAGGTP